MFLLDREGALTPVLDALPANKILPSGEILVMDGVHNGTVFSTLAQKLAVRPDAQIYIQGPLIPDQARLAFQVGAAGLLLEDATVARHGFAAWRGALAASLSSTYLYASTRKDNQSPLWAQRHAAQPHQAAAA